MQTEMVDHPSEDGFDVTASLLMEGMRASEQPLRLTVLGSSSSETYGLFMGMIADKEVMADFLEDLMPVIEKYKARVIPETGQATQFGNVNSLR